MISSSSRALSFLDRGWQPVPVPRKEKGPRVPGWQNLRVVPETVSRYFQDPEANVGILTGECSQWLVDVDIDVPEAIQIAYRFLPPTQSVFGRIGKPRSHWLYYARGARPARHVGDLEESGKRPSLVELRANGMQTIAPGSVHPSGESVEWDEDGPPAVVDADALERAVAMLAEASRLMRAGWDMESACHLARQGRVAAQPPARERMHTESTFADAVARYNDAHRKELPRSGGECPACGHNGCFGRMPDDPTRWYCWSTAHVAPGLKGVKGYHGDALDLDAHAAGMSRVELLRREGLLADRDERRALPERNTERAAEQTRKLKFMSASEYMDAWSNLPEVVTVATGIGALDRALGGGLPACQVTQVVGGPGSRKSELVRQIRNYVARAGHHVLHVDAELTIGLLGLRDISQASTLASAAVRDRKGWNDLQAETITTAQNELAALKTLWVLCTPPVPLHELDAAVQDVIEQTKDNPLPRLIILDSLQQLSFGVEAKERRHEVERFVSWANKLAQTTGSAVLITSERKRGNGDTGDVLHSAAESRSVEYQSAVVLVLEPEGQAEDEIAGAARSEWERRVRIVVAKNREGQKGKLPDTLVFTGPSWGYRVEPAEDELAASVIAQLRQGGVMGSTEIASALKKRRHAVDAVLDWLVDTEAVERLRIQQGRVTKVKFALKGDSRRSSDERGPSDARPAPGTSWDRLGL